jgi:hypothetical protein
MNDTPTGYPPDLDAAVRERQGAPVPKVRIVVPTPTPRERNTCDYDAGWSSGYEIAFDQCIAAIRAAGCVPVNAKGEEL